MQTILNSSLFIRYGVMAQRKSSEVPWVTFENEDDTTISITPKWTQSDVVLQYSFDTSTWFDATSGTEIENTGGNIIYMRGKTPTDKTLYTDNTSSNTWVTDATKITGNLNFLLCDDLGDLEAPTALDDYAFAYMFRDCMSLVTAPELPATTLAEYCYTSMFYDCTALVTAPELPATTLASNCYSYMFYGCSSLTTAPELPATTLADACYYGMFNSCTSLVTAPELPATTLADACYYGMFMWCDSLTTVPELPATTLADDCYNGMFVFCSSLTTAPELPATTLATSCYSNMFGHCTSLTSITMYYTGSDFTSYTYDWVLGISTTGTFYKAGEQWPFPFDSTYPFTWTQVQI